MVTHLNLMVLYAALLGLFFAVLWRRERRAQVILFCQIFCDQNLGRTQTDQLGPQQRNSAKLGYMNNTDSQINARDTKQVVLLINRSEQAALPVLQQIYLTKIGGFVLQPK